MKIKQFRVKFFANAVLSGLRSVEELPEAYREPVQEYLDEKVKEFERQVEEEAKRQGLEI